MAKIVRVQPGPGQESVWDYPRPPRVESTPERVVVRLGGAVIVASSVYIAQREASLARAQPASTPPAVRLPHAADD